VLDAVVVVVFEELVLFTVVLDAVVVVVVVFEELVLFTVVLDAVVVVVVFPFTTIWSVVVSFVQSVTSKSVLCGVAPTNNIQIIAIAIILK
jgi:hypothetical protein